MLAKTDAVVHGTMVTSTRPSTLASLQ